MSLKPAIRSITAILLACAAAAAAQNREGAPAVQQESLLRIRTELVQIDVVVTGRDGRPVSGLRREDFELLEDGRPQQLTHFAAGTATKPANWIVTSGRLKTAGAGDTSPSIEARAGRFIVLAVDDFHLAPENLLNARRVLEKFVRNQIVAGDQVAIVTTSGNIGLLQQFTSDREVLLRAIKRLSVQERTATYSFDIPRITDYQAELIDRGDPDALELAIQEILQTDPQAAANRPPQTNVGALGGQRNRGSSSGQGGQGGGGGGMSPRERAAEQARMKARSIISLNANYSRATLSNIESVIRSLASLTGRKMVVLLSDGFLLGGTLTTQTFDIRRITDAATRAGAVIYSIDTRGLVAVTPGGSASDPSRVEAQLPGLRARIEQSAVDARRDPINALASDSGGFLVLNTNDLNLGIQKVLDDNEFYYVLAYEPPESRSDGRFHRIELKIAGRPDLTVRTRKGYFAPSEKKEKANNVAAEGKKRDRQDLPEIQKIINDDLKTGLTSLVPIRDVPVQIAADFINTAETGPTAVVNAHIDASTLRFRSNKNASAATLDLTLMIFDEAGKTVHRESERLTFNLGPEIFETAIRQGFSYRKAVPLRPGFYQARIAVREDETARLGSATSWLDIPDMSRRELTLSGIFLASADDIDTPGATSTSSIPVYQPRPSTARRRFKIGGKIDYFVVTYNAAIARGTADLGIQSQIFSGSTLVYTSPLARISVHETADLQRIPYAARFLLDGFEPGEYELRLTIIDRNAKNNASRSVRFFVEARDGETGGDSNKKRIG